jgi:hypothetical protein
MFSESVDQNPTVAVTTGKTARRNDSPSRAPPAANALGALNIGPNPPAAHSAHAKSASVSAMSNGAAYSSTLRMLSMPL